MFLPEKDHLLRAAGPDELREPLRAAGAGEYPELDLGRSQLRVRGADPEIAGKGELQAAPQGEAGYRGDHGDREVLHRVEGIVEAEFPRLRRSELRHGRDVRACGEIIFAAGDHQGPRISRLSRMRRTASCSSETMSRFSALSTFGLFRTIWRPPLVI